MTNDTEGEVCREQSLRIVGKTECRMIAHLPETRVGLISADMSEPRKPRKPSAASAMIGLGGKHSINRDVLRTRLQERESAPPATREPKRSGGWAIRSRRNRHWRQRPRLGGHRRKLRPQFLANDSRAIDAQHGFQSRAGRGPRRKNIGA